jgi:signal transduction histidine kinase
MTGRVLLRSMDTVVPTLATLRQARAERVTVMRRWALPIALASAAALGGSVWQCAPHPGLHGTSLGISLAACGFLAASLVVIWSAIPLALIPVHGIPTRGYTALVMLLVASSVVLELLQPRGPALVGLLLSLSVVARLSGPRLSTALLVACLAFVAGIDEAGLGGWSGLSSFVGLVAFVAVFGVSLFARRIRTQEGKEERLLAKLEESRAAELRAAALAERQQLAREMHDVLAHSLSGLVLQLEGARLLAVTAPDDARLPAAMDRAHQLACDGLDEARQVIATLRGDELPGPQRLAELADGLAADISVSCRFSETGTPRDLAPAVQLALYRVTQEALTNVRKHAHPDMVQVRLEYLPESVTLTVQDFGAARAADRDGRPSGGYGLTGMRERARLLGGNLDASCTRDGFRVLLRVPA